MMKTRLLGDYASSQSFLGEPSSVLNWCVSIIATSPFGTLWTNTVMDVAKGFRKVGKTLCIAHGGQDGFGH